ncbi:DUF2851 family protein [Fodinibius sediminis]|uniref:DUF2851 domain-containing protein n=1 Tax=Fodinibius sediminis TaxID=1214077 RepID=A0A521D458_9BACT|nr:DUF2851 family protein [Fodinibius sediminis]SMO66447.1 Protein of unknown function [Fodinibius sediminis]
MSRPQASYHERLLHWIWETGHFDTQGLATIDGREVTIHEPGRHNKTDGPDFKGAEITIGNLRWYGDIEIHWKLADWRSHAHGTDPRYNKVILHIVLEKTSDEIQRQDQTSIPTLWLGQYLADPLGSFLTEYLRHPQLPCSRHLSFISEAVFLKQLEKAHREYFEQKVEDLLPFYDASLPPSRAWRRLVSIAFFDGLGIAHNRAPMRRLCSQLYDQIDACSSADALRKRALSVSGAGAPSRSGTGYQWNHKGCRPANHPAQRVQQAALGLWHIHHLPFGQWLTEHPYDLWDGILSAISLSPSIGKERSSILFGIVLLPALYILGNLFHSEALKTNSWNIWKHHQAQLPKSLISLFEGTGLSPSSYNKKLGTIHQLRNYCKAGQCQECFVFKNAISS